MKGLRSSARRNALCAVVIVVFSVLIQLAFLGVLPASARAVVSADYNQYYAPVAESITAGNGITWRGRLAVRYPPGYPVILAGIFSLASRAGAGRLASIITFNVVASSLSALLIFSIAAFLFNARVGLLASLLWAAYPFGLWLIKGPHSEVPFITLLLAGTGVYVYAFHRKSAGLYSLAGGLLAAAALIRPIALFLVGVYAAWTFFGGGRSWPTRVINVGVLLVGFLVVIAPWEVKVFTSRGRFIPLSTGAVPSVIDGLTFGVTGAPAAPVAEDVKMLMRRLEAERAEVRGPEDVLAFLAGEVTTRPASLGKLLAIKAARSWFGVAARHQYEKYILAVQLGYFALIVPGIIVAFRRFRGNAPFLCILLITVLYFYVMTIAVLSILRYMVPAMALLLVFAAVAADAILGRLGGRRAAAGVSRPSPVAP